MLYRVCLSLGVILMLAGCSSSVDSTSHITTPPVEYRRGGKIVLGSPSLTAGIPGRGPLEISEIDQWLDDPKNHEPLDLSLPAHFDAAEELVVLPDDNPLTRAKIELGRQLFFDKRMSGLGQVTQEASDFGFSCATCHQPRQAFAAYIVMPEIARNAPPIFNRLFSREQFWDGKAKSLEDQPRFPISNRFEMNTSPQHCETRLAKIEGYRLQFERIFGGLKFENVSKALACFQRALVTGASAWDYDQLVNKYEAQGIENLNKEERLTYREAKSSAAANPMSAAAKRGEKLFFSDRTRCSECHSGPNFTDEQYYNLGVPPYDSGHPDPGRYKVSKRKEDRGAFKTPTLRNVTMTPPYMHAGQIENLADVISWFSDGGMSDGDDSKGQPTGEIEPLNLTAEEQQDLLAFLECLNSPLPPIETGRLPRD